MILALALAAATTTASASADLRVAVVVGNDVGLDGEAPLDYAEDDARRVRDLLVEVGDIDAERAYLVLGGDAGDVKRALLEATGRLLELRQHGRTSLIVYVSAHADEDSLHLGGTKLPIAELRAAMARTRADLRLAIVDGCRTAVRLRGGRPVPDVAVRFDRSTEIEGDLLIRSASDGEPAQEWTYLRGGLFTHHLLVGLRGVADLDDDQRVTLSEAYGYAYRKTVAQAATSAAGPQHPSFDFDVRGIGQWVLARPSRLGGTIVLDESVAGSTWIANRANELVAEVTSVAGERLAVALAPGWYRVVVRRGQTAHVADVNLTWGGTRALAQDDLVRVPLSRARLRGRDPIVLRPWSLATGYALASGTVAGLDVEHRAYVRVARRFGSIYVRAAAAAGTGAFRGVASDVTHQTLRFTPDAGYEWPVGPLMVGLGTGPRIELVRQRVRRDDAADIERVFGRTEPTRGDVIFGWGAHARIALPVLERMRIALEVEPAASRVPDLDDNRLAFTVEGRASAELAF